METAHITYMGELRTKSVHQLSGTEIMTDAPPDNQGKGERFSPTDMAATSLGTCMLTIMGISARNHNYDIDGTTVKITKIMANNPRRIAEIIVELTFPHDNYTEEQRRYLDHAAKNCPVALSLHPDLKQTVIMHFKKDQV